ncbi:uncharacterized protein LOC144115531 isoform X9 [Amblyomma americanum]
MTASFGTSRRTALTFLEITARRVRPGPLVLLLCVTPTRSKPHRSHWRLLSRAIFGQWAKFSANQEPERFSGPRLTAANHHLMQFRSWSPPALECTLTGQLGLPHRGDIGVAGKL